MERGFVNSDSTELVQSLSSVAVVGAIEIAFSLSANILFPHAVPKEEFAAYRLFLLYSGYAGILHMGLLDGLYLRAVGYKTADVPFAFISRVKLALLGLQLLALLAVFPLLLSLGIPDSSFGFPLILVGVIAGTNFLTFYTYLLQATNNFGPVARIVGTARAAGALVAIGVILFGVATAMRLALCQLVPVVIGAVLLGRTAESLQWRRETSAEHTGDVGLVPAWRAGATLFLGNLGITVALTAGTLLASLVLTRQAFADFAFAAGLALVFMAVFEWLAMAGAPLHAKLALAGSQSGGWERLFLAMMWLSPLMYWGAVLIVRVYLDSYKAALDYLAWFAASLPFIGIVRVRAAIVCRALRRQDVYFKLGVVGATVVGCCVVGAWALTRSALAIAIGWTLGFAVAGSLVWLLVARAGRLPALRVDVVLVGSAVAAGLLFAAFRSLPSQIGGLAAYLAVGTLAFEAARRRLAGWGA
jgi:hypothetical protein